MEPGCIFFLVRCNNVNRNVYICLEEWLINSQPEFPVTDLKNWNFEVFFTKNAKLYEFSESGLKTDLS